MCLGQDVSRCPALLLGQLNMVVMPVLKHTVFRGNRGLLLLLHQAALVQ